MSLAGHKERTKISNDPRNTHWSSDTSRFGHRMLTDLGWKPGSTLGDTTSAYHAGGHLTAASATGVKIVLKGDNLGIGCGTAGVKDECTGLDVFQGVLGRLNGRDVEKEDRDREKMRREVIVGERYGMVFVRGETYVSSDIGRLVEQLKGDKSDDESGERKRKRSGGGGEGGKKEEKKRSREKKEKKRRRERESVETVGEEEEEETGGEAKSGTAGDAQSALLDLEEELLRNISEMCRKDKKCSTKKDKKKSKKKKSSKRKGLQESTVSEEDEGEGDRPPAAAEMLTGRRAIRGRFIAAKRMALDPQALNEIFMVRTGAI